ncbi:D-tyrosyl-tRNA(Tyr) deacylase [Mycoplasmatota bacterium]|nr:D-tyrosyl-tRNA(Tyr) deacylase [Mycoplasmatota bacterium]
MKIVIQRVSSASVEVEKKIVGQIDDGLMLLVGVTHEDTQEDIDYLVRKIINMRIFEDEEGKMNKSLIDTRGRILSISQFTLYANSRKGNRPSFVDSAKPDHAEKLYNKFNEELKNKDIRVETGIFGEHMNVTLVNDGSVTIVIDSKNK